MDILSNIKYSAQHFGSATAFHSRSGNISYRELWRQSDAIASFLDTELGDDRSPVVVFGHKDPLMLVCFLGCVKSGRAYCPVDTSMPADRISDIAEAAGNGVLFATEDFDESMAPDGVRVLSSEEIKSITSLGGTVSEDKWNKPEDIFYIIFTSGSTGKPKGVQISTANLNAYVEWAVKLGDFKHPADRPVYLDQAPFSFDLSVMDLYTCLARGGELWSVDKKLTKDIPALVSYIAKGNIDYFVSTPSFADVCLGDPAFNGDNLKSLDAFLFCGETLTKKTTERLMERFPDAQVINTYGPTETTVCISSVVIDNEMLADDRSLPIGIAKPGTEVLIIGDDGDELEAGKAGELVITGDTVSPGYYQDPAKTKDVFFAIKRGEKTVRAYRTGDSGYKDETGMLYYEGRIDQQIKLNGYRIELGDIEQNILLIDGVEKAAVVPNYQDGKVKNLAAFIVKAAGSGIPDGYEGRKYVRKSLAGLLPKYMVPKVVNFIDVMPLTGNGKIDRGQLRKMI
ncbi:MAG: D-alanine--poly(phosphoribitol) ligase subunit DltA [Eubacteriales bacterium]|nr:D-alanine--poly(phosphoribitol) ligase subunit DltA [Eubacteriales bacterium]